MKKPITYTLTSKTMVGRDECYTYSGTNGAIVNFRPHPTTAWSWIIDNKITNDIGRKVTNKVIDLYCACGNDDGRPFEERIKVLQG